MLCCPDCGMLLGKEPFSYSKPIPKMQCRACPYVFPITSSVVLHKTTHEQAQNKQDTKDDVFGSAESWANVDSIEVTCPKCENNRAYYMQIQIRSADEPSTIFYKCCRQNCAHQWREG